MKEAGSDVTLQLPGAHSSHGGAHQAGRSRLGQPGWQLTCQGETCPWFALSSTGLAALEQRPLPCPKPSPPNGVSQHPGVDCKADGLVGNGARLPRRGEGSSVRPLCRAGWEAMGQDWGLLSPQQQTQPWLWMGLRTEMLVLRRAPCRGHSMQPCSSSTWPRSHGVSSRTANLCPAALSESCECDEGEIRAGDRQTAAQQSVG